MATRGESSNRRRDAVRYRPSVTSWSGSRSSRSLLVWLGVNLVKTPSDFLQIFLIGLTLGAIYALSRSATRSSTASSS